MSNHSPRQELSEEEKVFMREVFGDAPHVGQVYQHNRTGRKYRVMLVDVECAGHLRHLVPAGDNFHVYQCESTKKLYARLTTKWEEERHGFTLL